MKEPYLTKMDIVKTEHDLISKYIQWADLVVEDGVSVRTEDLIKYIDGIRTMAEALMDLLAEYEKQDIVLPYD